MYRENGLKFSDFVCNDRFQLDSYLLYLFQQFYSTVVNQPEDKIATRK
ncbi:MAG TPA: hypothetical protein VEY51_20065 [Chondromyces sp.]|nr:hypothetical protein [Chondromyces sp.]